MRLAHGPELVSTERYRLCTVLAWATFHWYKLQCVAAVAGIVALTAMCRLLLGMASPAAGTLYNGQGETRLDDHICAVATHERASAWKMNQTKSTAASIFSRRYAHGGWGDGVDLPRSGAGSTAAATWTTCAMLEKAVSLVAAERPQQPVRIVDLPCGDFTWMPGCLREIDAKLRSRGQATCLHYQGVDAVGFLIRQLNARRGLGRSTMVVNGVVHRFPPSVTIMPFQVVDITDAQLRSFVRADIVLSKHALIHTSNALVNAALNAWNGLGARFFVTDTWCPGYGNCSRGNVDISQGDYRELDLHQSPFNLLPPLHSVEDHALCAATRKCNSRIELYSFPLKRGPPVPSPPPPLPSRTRARRCGKACAHAPLHSSSQRKMPSSSSQSGQSRST